jgi:hypothetical protein
MHEHILISSARKVQVGTSCGRIQSGAAKGQLRDVVTHRAAAMRLSFAGFQGFGGWFTCRWLPQEVPG